MKNLWGKLLLSLTSIVFIPFLLHAQIEPPDREYLFSEDKNVDLKKEQTKKEINEKRKQANELAGKELPFDIDATDIQYDTENKVVIAKGGVIVTTPTAVLEAEEGKFFVETNQAELKGDVRITEVSGTLYADSAEINLVDGTGKIKKADIYFKIGDYRIKSEETEKLVGDTFLFKNTVMSTCGCPGETSSLPWQICGKEAKVTREGYGQVWGATLEVKDIPVFYTPYLAFPAKSERQSGFLPATVGQSNQDGFELALPFFWAINDSSDATITPIIETDTRVGANLDYRKIFSRSSNMDFGGMYFNESARDGQSRGIDTTGFNDPSIDEDRLGLYLDHNWKGDLNGNPMQFIVDGNYVSDNLLLLENENDMIADQQARYVISRAVFRAPLGDVYSLDLSSEYTQAIVDDQDTVFQRLPELNVIGFHSFKPFGENPYGAKLNLANQLSAVSFQRDEGYTGTRTELFEEVKLPFHFRNYFDAELSADARGSIYNLQDTESLEEDVDPLESNSDRLVPGVSGRVSTVVEKVSEVSEDSWLKNLAELGEIGRKEKLARVKHTLEPSLRYRFVPDVDQDDNPQFDSYDHLDKRNVVTYQLTQRLFGRYEPRNEYLYGLQEATPEVEDLPTLRSPSTLNQQFDFGYQGIDELGGGMVQTGQRREFGNFTIGQSYNLDNVEDVDDDSEEEDVSSGQNEFSDVSLSTLVFPNEYFRVSARADWDPNETQFSAYLFGAQLNSKRGDLIRSRISFIRDSEVEPLGYDTRQIETGAEMVLTSNLKLGHYSRYDDVERDFIESKIGLRVSSSCNCWIFDLQYGEQINPDQSVVSFNITLIGLGGLGNNIFSNREDSGS